MFAIAQRCLSVILALALASVTACSGSKSGAASSADASPAPAVPAGASVSADAAGSGASTAVIEPCKKLALSDVQPFFTAPLSAKHDDDLIGSAAGCIYHTPDDHTNVQIVAVTGLHAESFYDANSKRNGVTGVPLSGIGDKAVRDAGDVWVYAMKNGVFCMVDGDSHGRGSLKGAEKYADATIPDAIAGPIAQQLATLCAKLWQ